MLSPGLWSSFYFAPNKTYLPTVTLCIFFSRHYFLSQQKLPKMNQECLLMAKQGLMCKTGEALELIFRVKRCSSLCCRWGSVGMGTLNALPHHPCPLDTEGFFIFPHHPLFYDYQWVHVVSVSDIGFAYAIHLIVTRVCAIWIFLFPFYRQENWKLR